jgi:hypothetical protein
LILGKLFGLVFKRGPGNETIGSEEVGVRYVLDVGPVEHVRVVADLEVGLVAFVDLCKAGHDLAVSGAVNEKVSIDR